MRPFISDTLHSELCSCLLLCATSRVARRHNTQLAGNMHGQHHRFTQIRCHPPLTEAAGLESKPCLFSEATEFVTDGWLADRMLTLVRLE